MRLTERIVVTIGVEAIELRPSLAAAMRLAEREGSLGQLARDVSEGSLTAAMDILSLHIGDTRYLAVRAFDALASLQDPLLRYIDACACVDRSAPAKPGGKMVPFTDFLLDLYRIGTGWLGWTPQVTLAATPAEIEEAYKGRLDMLRQVFGGEEPAKPASSLDSKFRLILGGRGTLKATTVE